LTNPQAEPARQEKIAQRIRSAVFARLGDQIDAKLLDTIIERVLKSTGVK
jgi:chorismate mutase